ncbi:MAG: hypothetical protein AAFU79_31155, partial [Myxococcota bacterium]
MHTLRPGLLCVLALNACGEETFAEEDFDDGVCEPTEPAGFIDLIARDWYLFPDQLPDVDLSEGDSRAFLQRLVEGVDFDPSSDDRQVGDRYSYVTSVAAFEQANDGDFVGLGFRQQFEGPEDGRFLRLIEVFGSGPREAPTPASEAGLRRGDRIFAINGSRVADLVATRPAGTSEGAAVDAAFGEPREGEAVTLAGERRDGTAFSVRIVRRPIEFNEVPNAAVLVPGPEPIGYMVLRSFTTRGVLGELFEAVGALEEQRVTRLIV